MWCVATDLAPYIHLCNIAIGLLHANDYFYRGAPIPIVLSILQVPVLLFTSTLVHTHKSTPQCAIMILLFIVKNFQLLDGNSTTTDLVHH